MALASGLADADVAIVRDRATRWKRHEATRAELGYHVAWNVSARAQREIEIMQNTKHPNVITLFEIYDEPKKMTLVMELVRRGQGWT